MTFRLYPKELHWWSFADYGAVLSVMRRLQPASVLEFGPGSSTLALIEGGARSIDCCEDNPDWLNVYQERLAQRYDGVRMLPYTWSDPLVVPGAALAYDMALIDGPHGTERRPTVLRYALARCTHVLMCCEDSKGRGLRAPIMLIAEQAGRPVEIMETGPLSGSFALIGP